MKKFKVYIISLILLFGIMFSGCGNTSQQGGGGTEGNFYGTLNIIMFKGGYGDAWIKDIAAAYKTKNPKVTVRIKTTVSPASEISTIEAGTAGYDIYLMIDNMFNLVNRKLLADLTPVYEYAEPGQDKTVKEKMNPYYEEAFRMDDGKYYLMPWSNSQEGLIYNKSVLDEYFPEGLQMPRTTNEMFEVFDKIKAKNLYAFNYSGIDDYLPYLFIPWWAQYEGHGAYMDYYQGYYKNEQGERVFSKNAEVFKQQGRLESLRILERMCNKDSGYVSRYTNDMDFMKAQLAFLGHGYNNDYTPSIFSTNGEWLENEIDFALREKPQELRFVKTPVISSITDKTVTITSDETLRLAVDYVDNITDIKPEGVSDEDLEYVRQARNMANSVGQDHNLGVVKSSKVLPLAIDFLKFMTTTNAGKIFSRDLNGLILPYGSYDPLNDPDAVMSGYIRSKHEAFKDCIPVYQDRKPVLVYRGGHCAFGVKFGSKLFDKSYTAQSFFDMLYNTYSENWVFMVNQSGLNHLL